RFYCSDDRKQRSTLEYWKRQLTIVHLKLYQAHRMARYADERKAIRHALYQYQEIQSASAKEYAQSKKTATFISPMVNDITLLLHATNCEQAMYLVDQIRSQFPTTQIYAGVEGVQTEQCTTQTHTEWIWGVKDTKQLWFQLGSLARTELIFVGRNLIDFSVESNLKSLIYYLYALNADVIGGAVRLEPEGKWFAGCYKTSMRNHVLRFHPGHDLSEPPCTYCDYIASPFIIRRDLFLLGLKQNVTMSGILAHINLMLRLNYDQLIPDHAPRILSCMDTMFHVSGQRDPIRGRGISEIPRSDWLPLVRQWGLNQILVPGPRLHRWTCVESEFQCDRHLRSGEPIPPCCEEERKQCIQWFLRKTESLNISVALFHLDTVRTVIQLLGSILPWPNLPVLGWDASNMTSAQLLCNSQENDGSLCKIKPVATADLLPELCHPIPDRLCQHYQLYSSSPHAYLIAYTKHTPDLIPELNNSTRVKLYGHWLITYWNPGIKLRNRYKTDLFDLYDQNANNVQVGKETDGQLDLVLQGEISNQIKRQAASSRVHRSTSWHIFRAGSVQFDPFII
ncbi:hypothetical protein FBUS_05058, partial [Fasciolopsis buskii]